MPRLSRTLILIGAICIVVGLVLINIGDAAEKVNCSDRYKALKQDNSTLAYTNFFRVCGDTEWGHKARTIVPKPATRYSAGETATLAPGETMEVSLGGCNDSNAVILRLHPESFRTHVKAELIVNGIATIKNISRHAVTGTAVLHGLCKS